MLLTGVSGVGEAHRALAGGADLLDLTHCPPKAAAAVRARYPDAVWPGAPAGPDRTAEPGPPGPGALVDADLTAAAGRGGDAPLAAVVAVAAVSTWLGAAAVRTRHVRAARRAIDMTASIAGRRPPALTTRGLA
jgi:hypothetical protein